MAVEYDRGRPEYPLAVIGALGAELGLAPGARVLDLGAGTGKVSRALLAVGFDVLAVEPLAPLRELLAQSIGAERVLEGTAEAIPVADASVNAVTIGDAFHWFDQRAALAEIARVLRPGGGLAILITLPDWSGASWAHEVGQLVMESRPDHPHFDGPPWHEAVRAAGGWSDPVEITVKVPQATSPDRIVAHLASISWIAGMTDDERQSFLGRIRALIDAGETPPELPARVVIGLTRPV